MNNQTNKTKEVREEVADPSIRNLWQDLKNVYDTTDWKSLNKQNLK